MNFRAATRSVLKSVYQLAASNRRRGRRNSDGKKKGPIEEDREYLFKSSDDGTLVEVIKVKGETQLWVDGAEQTKSGLFASYCQYWSLLPSFYRNPSILLLGLGGGTTCRIFEALYQDYHIDVVDISPAVVAAAKEYFGISEGKHLKVYVEDAYEFALHPPRSYDIVIVDTFQGKSIPQHLLTKEFFIALTKILSDDGILTMNLSGPAIRTGLSSLVSTLSTLQFTISFLFTENRTNMIVYCLKGNLSLDEFTSRLRTAAQGISNLRQETARVAAAMEDTLYAIKDAQMPEHD